MAPDPVDVITSDRRYRKGRTADEATRILLEEAYVHLDRPGVRAALRILATETSLDTALSESAELVATL